LAVIVLPEESGPGFTITIAQACGYASRAASDNVLLEPSTAWWRILEADERPLHERYPRSSAFRRYGIDSCVFPADWRVAGSDPLSPIGETEIIRKSADYRLRLDSRRKPTTLALPCAGAP
jgi:hypothetical protein